MLISALALTSLFLGLSHGGVIPSPIVHLSQGSYQGNTTGDLEVFLGMHFAAPPVGNLRFAPPQPAIPFSGVRPAVSFGAACPQQNFNTFPGFSISQPPLVTSEDCLFINVVKPANVAPGKRLPVLVWIYGGGFETGDTSANPGNTVVQRSITLNEPVIYVSANYRLSALGFLGGKEVKEAGLGNAGLRDQRFAFKWVQQNIAAFGGDPDQVTIWGESAGAVSVGLQLVVNDGNTEGLFHSAVMESGSPLALLDITHNQPFFDQIVADTGCSGSSDLIGCLRQVPLDDFTAAMNNTPSLFSFMSLQVVWTPTVDGIFLTRDAQASVEEGLFAKVPIITGDCDDEGTLFSFTTLNLTTNAEYLSYIKSNYFPSISDAELAALGQAYPDDITQGSPFDTGTANALTPEYKRIAAFQGDWAFQAPRRLLLQKASQTLPTYAFLFKRGKATLDLGAFHSSDIPEFYGTDPTPDFIGTDALVNFANKHNPNTKNTLSLLSKINWPQWGSNLTAPPLLTFVDPAPSVLITPDTYRQDAMVLLNKLNLQMDGGN